MICPSCEVMIRGGQLSVLYELDKKRLGILSLVSKHIKDTKRPRKIFFENLYNFCTNMYLT